MMYDSLTDLTDCKPHNLYDRIESLISDRSVYGRGRTPEAQQFRSVINPEIRRLRRELRQRGLPSRRRDFESSPKYWSIAKPRWMVEAERQAADVADLRDTQQDVIYG